MIAYCGSIVKGTYTSFSLLFHIALHAEGVLFLRNGTHLYTPLRNAIDVKCDVK